MRILIICCAYILIYSVQLLALPQFSLISGNRCSSCHVNSQGSGLRNDLGWYSYRDVGAFNPENINSEGLWGLQDSIRSMIGNKGNIGFDMRLQLIRSRNESKEQRILPMQMSIYGNYQLLPWLQAEGNYNIGPVKYPGQQSWSASVIVQSDNSLPQLRLGFFQPTIGIRYDDHTMMIRQLSAGWINENVITPYNSMTILAPYFSAAGAEFTYESIHELTLNAGVFSNATAQQNSVSNIDEGSLMYSARAVYWPRFFDNTINSYIGTSILHNHEFSLINAFMGIGLTDKLSFMVDMSLSNLQDITSRKMPLINDSREKGKNTSYLAELTWQATSWFLPFTRFEYSELIVNNSYQSVIKQMVFGAQVFPLPNIEIRPEYRIYDTSAPGYISRWGAQLHLYY